MGGLGGIGRFSGIVRLFGLGLLCLALGNCASSNITSKLERHHKGATTETKVAAAERPVAAVGRTARHGRHKTLQTLIVCDQRGCSDRPSAGRPAMQALAYANEDGTVVGSRPAGCPHAYCGCEASRYIFGEIRTELLAASSWARKFPRSSPAPGAVAVRSHHVMVLMHHVGGDDWMVHDGNSGGGLTRDHVVSIRGFTIVNPRGI